MIRACLATRIATHISLGLLMSSGAACADDPPSPALVEDLRILAIRADPPELLIDRLADLNGDQPSQRGVAFEALVLDPRGGPMQFGWRFCPIDSNQTCGDFDERRKLAPAAFQPALDAARAQTLAGEVTLTTTDDAAGIENFTVPVTNDLFTYHLADSALGLGNGAWASAVLEVKSAHETLTAQKRVVLAARDLSQWNPELATQGWQVCTAENPTPGCTPLRPRIANHNPTITGVEVARGSLATTQFEPLAERLVVAPGEKLRLRPLFTADSEEPFQVVESTLQSDQLVVTNHSEELIVSWFSTAGAFSDEQTARQLTKTLDNLFTAPAVAPTNNTLSIFVVARDQRGGVAWTQVHVDVVVEAQVQPQAP
jgi:hypothetical protein